MNKMKSGYVILKYSTAMMGQPYGVRHSPTAYREAYLASQTLARREFIEGRSWSGSMLDDQHVKITLNCWMSDDEINEFLELFNGCKGKVESITELEIAQLTGRV
jgi:hypothetical protein